MPYFCLGNPCFVLWNYMFNENGYNCINIFSKWHIPLYKCYIPLDPEHNTLSMVQEPVGWCPTALKMLQISVKHIQKMSNTICNQSNSEHISRPVLELKKENIYIEHLAFNNRSWWKNSDYLYWKVRENDYQTFTSDEQCKSGEHDRLITRV